MLAPARQVSAFGEVLAQQPVRVLVRAALPWAVRIGKEDANPDWMVTVVNAGEAASRLVVEVAQHAKALQLSDHDAGFYVPFSTMTTCRFTGGHANNVIPEEADFDFDLRYLPATDPHSVIAPLQHFAAALEAELRQTTSEASVTIERRTAAPPLAADSSADALALRILQADAQAGPHVAYTTEDGLYQAAEITTVICGPGEIAQVLRSASRRPRRHDPSRSARLRLRRRVICFKELKQLKSDDA